MEGGFVNFLVSAAVGLAMDAATSIRDKKAFDPRSLYDPFGFFGMAEAEAERKKLQEQERQRSYDEWYNSPEQVERRAYEKYRRENEVEWGKVIEQERKQFSSSRSILSRKPGTVVSGRTHAPVQGLPNRLAIPANKLGSTPDGRSPLIQKTFATGMNQRVSLGQAPPPPPNPQPPAQPPTTQLSKRYIAAAAANQRKSGALFGGM